MIYTIFLSTFSMPAYAAIHPIVIKSHVIKRELLFVAYHCTITTRKGPELYNKLLSAFQEAGIPKGAYKIRIEPSLDPPKGSNDKHGTAPRVKYSMPPISPSERGCRKAAGESSSQSNDSNPEGVSRH